MKAKIHYRVHNSLHLDSTPSQMNPVHVLTPYLGYILILSSHLCLCFKSDVFPSVFQISFVLHVPFISFSLIL